MPMYEVMLLLVGFAVGVGTCVLVMWCRFARRFFREFDEQEASIKRAHQELDEKNRRGCRRTA